MINDNTLNEAIAEAQRFIKRAKELQAASNESVGERGHWSTVAEHAACKRASMDLTRKLADLRAGR